MQTHLETAAPFPRTQQAPLAPGAAEGTWLERVSVAAFFALCAGLLARVALGATLSDTPVLLLAALLGYVGADLFSGLVHWAFDTWGERTTPVLGPTFIAPFRVHHDDPQDITRHGFLSTNGHNCFASLPVLAAALLWPASGGASPPLLTFLLALCLGVFGTNQFHKWAHEDAPAPWVAWLQARGLILSPAHHDVHHTAPYARHYCITTGWLNPLLERTGFFRRLERLVIRLSGAQPRRDGPAGTQA